MGSPGSSTLGALGNTFMLSFERGLNQGWRRARAGNVGISKTGTFSRKKKPQVVFIKSSL